MLVLIITTFETRPANRFASKVASPMNIQPVIGREDRKLFTGYKALEPYLVANCYSQPHKQASAQGHNNNKNNTIIKLELQLTAGCEAKVVAELSSCP